MADPTKPVVVARADFPFDRDDPAITGVKTAWDTPHVFASTEGDWLYAIDVSDPYAPFVASRTQTLVGLPRILAAEKDFVAVMAWTQDSYGIVPFTHPSLLEPVRNLDVLEYGGIRQVGCSFGRYAYIGLSNSDIFRIVDLFPDA